MDAPRTRTLENGGRGRGGGENYIMSMLLLAVDNPE